jgi:hypothetical protein
VADETLAQFSKRLIQSADDMEEEWLGGARKIASFAYTKLIANTENVDAVDTGAYRAEHAITQNFGDIIFGHPRRPGPFKVFSPRKARALPVALESPLRTGRDLEKTLERKMVADDFAFENDRLYAEYLEYGVSGREPRRIYGRTETQVERYIARVERER